MATKAPSPLNLQTWKTQVCTQPTHMYRCVHALLSARGLSVTASEAVCAHDERVTASTWNNLQLQFNRKTPMESASALFPSRDSAAAPLCVRLCAQPWVTRKGRPASLARCSGGSESPLGGGKCLLTTSSYSPRGRRVHIQRSKPHTLGRSRSSLSHARLPSAVTKPSRATHPTSNMVVKNAY